MVYKYVLSGDLFICIKEAPPLASEGYCYISGQRPTGSTSLVWAQPAGGVALSIATSYTTKKHQLSKKTFIMSSNIPVWDSTHLEFNNNEITFDNPYKP